LIDSFLLSKPTPTIGAPPKLAPGEPKAPLLPVVVVPPMAVVAVPPTPVALVPPTPVDEPIPPPVLGSVPPAGEVDDPLLPNVDPELPPMDDPCEEPREKPLPPIEDPEDPKDEPLPPIEDPEDPKDEPLPPIEDPEDPKDEPLPPIEDPEEPKGDDDPVEPATPLLLVSPGVRPVCCSAWPNNPMAVSYTHLLAPSFVFNYSLAKTGPRGGTPIRFALTPYDRKVRDGINQKQNALSHSGTRTAI